jgi:acyl carrier protein
MTRMIDSSAYSLLADVFREVFQRDDIDLTPELTAAEVEGWDSLKQFEIILAVEQRLDASFTSAEIGSLRRLSDLARLVSARATG